MEPKDFLTESEQEQLKDANLMIIQMTMPVDHEQEILKHIDQGDCVLCSKEVQTDDCSEEETQWLVLKAKKDSATNEYYLLLMEYKPIQ